MGELFTCAPLNGYTRIRTPFLYPDGDVIDLFNYVNPLLLVIVSTQLLAFEHGSGNGKTAQENRPEHPRFVERPMLIEENIAPAPVKNISSETLSSTAPRLRAP